MDPETKLNNINHNQTKFKISVVLILLEHLSIVFLAITLLIAFGPYNIILGIIWCAFRIAEGSIQIYDKKSYWRLLNTAIEYSNTTGAEKDALIDLSRNILNTKTSRFAFAQILFSIGTFAYSLMFVIYEVVPPIIGWFGIIVSIIYGGGNIIFQKKSNFKILWNIGGLLVLLFEIILGGWLLIFS